VQPKKAVFGLKDLQQCAVIERLVRGLNIPVQLCFQPTVRERDGLAMSSRNAYLSQKEREIAPFIYKNLENSRERLRSGDSPSSVLTRAKEALTEAGFVVDYYDLIERLTFRPIDQIGRDAALIAAVRLGNTRLIDNLLLFEH
jgi:pantoate--beta-alanine ligase